MADDRPMAGVIRTKPDTKAPKGVRKKAPAKGVKKAPASGRKRSSSKAAPTAAKRGTKTPIKRAPAKQDPAKKGPGKKAPAKKAKLPPALEVDPDVLEFIAAINRFKSMHNRPFPSWSEVLHVLHKLGYRKV